MAEDHKVLTPWQIAGPADGKIDPKDRAEKAIDAGLQGWRNSRSTAFQIAILMKLGRLRPVKEGGIGLCQALIAWETLYLNDA